MARGIFSVTLLLVLATSWAYAQEAAVIQRGKDIYGAYCGPCHGATGRGDGEMAQFLRGKPADLTRLKQMNSGQFPFWRVFGVIEGQEHIGQHGSREMPVWGTWFAGEQGSTDPGAWVDLTRGRIWQLIIYLESIQAE